MHRLPSAPRAYRHAQHRHWNGQSRHCQPVYDLNGVCGVVGGALLCLIAGVLLAIGVVFTVESVHVVLSDAYAVRRRTNGGAMVPYPLFGRQFDPWSAWTWAIPVVSILAGAALLPLARRLTRRGWTQALLETTA